MPIDNNGYFVSSVGWAAVPQWTASTAYSIGNVVRQRATPTVGNERCFVCTVAGTSLGSEPSWTISKYGLTTEAGGPAWRECTGLPAFNGDPTENLGWVASQSYFTVGVMFTNVAGTHVFWISTTGGTTATEPTYNTTPGATTSLGTAVVTCIGPTSAYGNFASPAPRMSCVATFNTISHIGQTMYVADNHAESQSSGSWACTPTYSCKILCVDRTATFPIANNANALKNTATVTNSASGQGMSITTRYCYGIQLINASAGTGPNIQFIAPNYERARFEQCGMSFTNAGATNGPFFLTGNSASSIEVIGCTFNFSHASQYFRLDPPNVTFKNCSFTGTAPSAFMTTLAGATNMVGTIMIEGCDLSLYNTNLFTGTQLGGNAVLKDCKLGASVNPCPSNANMKSGAIIDISRCDSGATTYRNERYTSQAAQTTRIDVARNNGAMDGVTPISHRIVMTTDAQSFEAHSQINHHPGMPLAIGNSVTGTNRNVTLYGITNDSRLPTDGEVWLDVEYLGSGSSPLASWKSGAKALFATATPLAADTSDWDDASTARANSTAYVVGDIRKVASNPGRLFFCTVAGTSAASEPAGGSETWSTAAADKGGAPVLSGGNLVATSGQANNDIIRADGAQGKGKLYFEITWTGAARNGCGVGLAQKSAAIASVYSNVTGGVGYFSGSGFIYINGSYSGISYPTWNGSSTLTICVAIDFENDRAWFRQNNGNWNNNASNDPATNVGGIDISSISLNAALAPFVSFQGATGQIATANFGGSAFSYTAPSGFSGVAMPDYSTAVDGDVVGDGGASFRAGYRFKQTLTLSSPQPGMAGHLYGYPKFARAGSTYYIDPRLELS